MQASTNENLDPAAIKKIMRDMQDFEKAPAEGIKLIINDDNIGDIHATITGPGIEPLAAHSLRRSELLT